MMENDAIGDFPTVIKNAVVPKVIIYRNPLAVIMANYMKFPLIDSVKKVGK